MAKKTDRRKHERFSAEEVLGNFSYSVEANVLNLSLGGLAVRTYTQLNIGRRYRFRVGDRQDAVHLSGAVRWCRLAGTEKRSSGDIVPVYEAGISFDEVLSEKAEELLEFMERNIILDLKRRIFGRFRVQSKGSVTLESDSKYLVRQLSTSGMMIEADVALKPETTLDLEMRLSRRKFTTPARIVYLAEVDLQNETLKYRMGVEFIGTAPEQAAKLEDFIRTELGKAGEPAAT